MAVDFNLPAELTAYLAELDDFIEREIKPLEREGDNIRFFDHRREWARTDWDAGGLPRKEWEELLAEARRRADAAGHLRYAWPKEMGGKGGSNLDMAVIREHLAAKGLGLHNDLQNEHSIVGNNPFILMFKEFATNAQYERYADDLLNGRIRTGFGLTEPNHGSDATHMETRAVPETRDGKPGWLINGEKMWTTGMHVATHVMVFARTSGNDGDAQGITCFLVPAKAPGVKIEEWLWTFNMPTDHPRVSFTDVWVPEESYWGEVGKGLGLGQSFVHQNRIRQAASSLGAAVYCIEESVKYARERKPFGKPLAENQAIQWPLVELATQAEMLRLLIRKTAWEMDRMPHRQIERELSDKVSMCNYWANRLVCEAADRAMQVHGGIGYSRHKPFEHIYRHHRRYRITEGSEEIQMRKVAAFLFGYMGPRRRAFAAAAE
ncbi:MAG: acyl-CoA dehydrogenase family protein [Phenylobacterium sp.]|jgi:alkylation response protein AidB-like acyl-CoA dehydrogenase|uniref:acyl-CoA dehydrogenase family protein n=1 Tax=Phenylobacterium sp. TaxID=1871053 RepID=UPI002A2FB3C5|nr:acyl-CoA dehydrogenase family protein [Phenylobacterium sp.]MDD3838942.1 acyl-CoA dehydrogenase family protein [Phenylobacterium sp.]MDX9996787.1 acyl-CoA dehydrogenase family protein [Phenylobacterium sp.]